MTTQTETILVFGATGLQGSMACQTLRNAGFKVIGVTRNKTSPGALQLLKLGVEVAQCNIEETDQLQDLPSAQAIYLILDSMHKDPETEFRQGLNVIRYAQTAGIRRLVYSSVGSPAADNDVAHFGVKNRLEQQLNSAQLEWTVLRPTAFMEGLVEKKFVPPVLWHVWSRATGWETPIQWIAVEDIAKAAAYAFQHPVETLHKTYTLVGDQLSLADVRQIFVQLDGKAPRTIPIPVWFFSWAISQDLCNLFYWYKAHGFQADPKEIYAVLKQPLDFPSWLNKRRKMSE